MLISLFYQNVNASIALFTRSFLSSLLFPFWKPTLQYGKIKIISLKVFKLYILAGDFSHTSCIYITLPKCACLIIFRLSYFISFILQNLFCPVEIYNRQSLWLLLWWKSYYPASKHSFCGLHLFDSDLKKNICILQADDSLLIVHNMNFTNLD